VAETGSVTIVVRAFSRFLIDIENGNAVATAEPLESISYEKCADEFSSLSVFAEQLPKAPGPKSCALPACTHYNVD
jgi:hypothetical protein